MVFDECTKSDLQTHCDIFPDGSQCVSGTIPMFRVYVKFQLGDCTEMLMWGVTDENHNICFMEKAGCVLPLNQRDASEHVLCYNDIICAFDLF